MKVHVLCFARVRELTGANRVTVELPENATIGELRHLLSKRFPSLAGFLPRCAVALADEFASDDTSLPAEAEVAILPPVSGG